MAASLASASCAVGANPSASSSRSSTGNTASAGRYAANTWPAAVCSISTGPLRNSKTRPRTADWLTRMTGPLLQMTTATPRPVSSLSATAASRTNSK